MGQLISLETMSIDKLWELHEEIREALTVKIKTEQQELNRRLVSLGSIAQAKKKRRPYPPVFPKFANPDAPEEVWSGRGKQPRWVAERLSSGLALEDLSILPSQTNRAVVLRRA